MSVPPHIIIPIIDEKQKRTDKENENENDLYLLKRHLRLNLSRKLYESIQTIVMKEDIEIFIKNDLIPLAKINNISLPVAFFKLAILLFPDKYMEILSPLLIEINKEETRLRTEKLAIKFLRPTSSDHYIMNRNIVQNYIEFDRKLLELIKYSILIFYYYIGYEYYDTLIKNTRTPLLDKIAKIAKNHNIPLDVAIFLYIYYTNKENHSLCESLAQLVQAQAPRMNIVNFDNFKQNLIKLIETSGA